MVVTRPPGTQPAEMPLAALEMVDPQARVLRRVAIPLAVVTRPAMAATGPADPGPVARERAVPVAPQPRATRMRALAEPEAPVDLAGAPSLATQLAVKVGMPRPRLLPMGVMPFRMPWQQVATAQMLNLETRLAQMVLRVAPAALAARRPPVMPLHLAAMVWVETAPAETALAEPVATPLGKRLVAQPRVALLWPAMEPVAVRLLVRLAWAVRQQAALRLLGTSLSTSRMQRLPGAMPLAVVPSRVPSFP